MINAKPLVDEMTDLREIAKAYRGCQEVKQKIASLPCSRHTEEAPHGTWEYLFNGVRLCGLCFAKENVNAATSSEG